MQEGNIDPEEIIKNMDASVINDKEALLKIIDEVIKENPQSVIDYKNGKNRVVGFLMGKVIKLTKGKANPSLTNQLIIEQLKGA